MLLVILFFFNILNIKAAKNVSPAPDKSETSAWRLGGSILFFHLTPFSPKVTINSPLRSTLEIKFLLFLNSDSFIFINEAFLIQVRNSFLESINETGYLFIKYSISS